jgi:PBP1b-binding outer membrane lipoprotein LpoB
MNKKSIITALLTAVLALTSCHQSAQKSEAEQQADSTETVTSADTLRLVDGSGDGSLIHYEVND